MHTIKLILRIYYTSGFHIWLTPVYFLEEIAFALRKSGFRLKSKRGLVINASDAAAETCFESGM